MLKTNLGYASASLALNLPISSRVRASDPNSSEHKEHKPTRKSASIRRPRRAQPRREVRRIRLELCCACMRCTLCQLDSMIVHQSSHINVNGMLLVHACAHVYPWHAPHVRECVREIDRSSIIICVRADTRQRTRTRMHTHVQENTRPSRIGVNEGCGRGKNSRPWRCSSSSSMTFSKAVVWALGQEGLVWPTTGISGPHQAAPG